MFRRYPGDHHHHHHHHHHQDYGTQVSVVRNSAPMPFYTSPFSRPIAYAPTLYTGYQTPTPAPVVSTVVNSGAGSGYLRIDEERSDCCCTIL